MAGGEGIQTIKGCEILKGGNVLLKLVSRGQKTGNQNRIESGGK